VLKPIDVAQLTEWSWEGDKGEPRAVFLLRPLTKRQRSLVQNECLLPIRRQFFKPDGTVDHVDVIQQTGSGAARYCKMGLAGVKDNSFPGWADEPAGAGLATSARVPTDAFLDSLPDQVLDAMAEKVQLLSMVTEPDAGK
jgi:hypothetical protein